MSLSTTDTQLISQIIERALHPSNHVETDLRRDLQQVIVHHSAEHPVCVFERGDGWSFFQCSGGLVTDVVPSP